MLYVRHVAPVLWPPRREKDLLLRQRSHALGNSSPRKPRGPVSLQTRQSPCRREGGRGLPPASCGSRPVSALGGLARVHVQGLQTVLTAHGTAPVELTLALGHPGDAGGVVASPAAHDFAAVHATGSQVAHSACCPRGAWKTIGGGVTEKAWAEYNTPQEGENPSSKMAPGGPGRVCVPWHRPQRV